jgi:ELWxxDGT repeat protein
VGDRLFFLANDGMHGAEPWYSDGTTAGTALIADLDPGAEPSDPTDRGEAVALGNTLVFTRESPFPVLWRTDGTASGTFRLLPDGVTASRLARLGSEVFFFAGSPAQPGSLWRTDGTVEGTREVASVARDHGSVLPVVFASRMFFTAWTPEHGTELWSSDGTPGGTALLRDLEPHGGWSSPRGLAVATDGVYFLITRSFLELWRSDGTESGTTRVAELPGELSPSGRIVGVATRIFVLTSTGLWASDGTEGDLRRILSVPIFLDAYYPEPAVVGQTLYFAASGLAGTALWRSDGTEAGTLPLLDASGGPIESPLALRAFAGKLHTVAALGGDEMLWESDGSSAGTRPLMRLGERHRFGTYPLEAVGSRLFFPARSRDSGLELWALPAP